MAEFWWLVVTLLVAGGLFAAGALFVVVFMQAAPDLFGTGDCEYLARLEAAGLEAGMPKGSRVRGTLRCADGAVVPITSKRVVDALQERDREIATLTAQLASRQERIGALSTDCKSAEAQLATVTAALESLRHARWVRLGRWLRVVR